VYLQALRHAHLSISTSIFSNTPLGITATKSSDISFIGLEDWCTRNDRYAEIIVDQQSELRAKLFTLTGTVTEIDNNLKIRKIT